MNLLLFVWGVQKIVPWVLYCILGIPGISVNTCQYLMQICKDGGIAMNKHLDEA